MLRLGGTIEEITEQAARVTAVMDWLASNQQWLLIVDNVDDEKAAAALVGCFGHLGTGHVLITTRLQNWSDNVEPLRIEELSLDDSTDLLLQLTDKKRRRTADEAAQARLLAEKMEGLPLALHQAAGYINEQRLTFAGYLAEYEREATELLGWFKNHVIHYERLEKETPKPVLITWKTSFDKLDDNTRFWLLVFAHFAPDPVPEFLLDSAANATDEVKEMHRDARRALAQAEAYSLLTRYDGLPRFKLHRLIQQILRLTAPEAECTAALYLGIRLFIENYPGNPLDVRNWKKWTPLLPHAVSLVTHAPDASEAQHLSWLLGELGNLFHTKGIHAEAERHLRRSLKLDEACYGLGHPDVALRLNNLAELLRVTNRLEESELLIRRALEIDEASYGKDHPNIARDLNNLALLLLATNRLAEAEPLMRRVVDITQMWYGKDHCKVATSLNNLAALLLDTNRLAEAEPLMRRALEIDEHSYGKDHPDVARDLNNLAVLLQGTNRLAEAEPLIRRALEIDEASYGKDHPDVARDLNNLATLLKATNRLEEAESLIRRGLQIEEITKGKDHPHVAVQLNNLALLLKANKRLAEAEPLMRRALAIDEGSLGKDHPAAARELNNLALLLQATNRLPEAEPLMRRALRILVRSLGPTHPNVQTVGRNYIGLLQDLNVTEGEIERRLQSVVEGE